MDAKKYWENRRLVARVVGSSLVRVVPLAAVAVWAATYFDHSETPVVISAMAVWALSLVALVKMPRPRCGMCPECRMHRERRREQWRRLLRRR